MVPKAAQTGYSTGPKTGSIFTSFRINFGVCFGLQNPFLRELHFLRFSMVAPESPSWPYLGLSWPVLAPSWHHLGPILAPSRPILAHLGALLASSWPLPGTICDPGGHLHSSWPVLATMFRIALGHVILNHTLLGAIWDPGGSNKQES